MEFGELVGYDTRKPQIFSSVDREIWQLPETHFERKSIVKRQILADP
jgi:hypothetical protein